jgi:hypothetical protein
MPMARRVQVEFVIGPDGRVTERVSGVKGAGCEKVTELIEQSLGKVANRERTGEYYEQDGGVQGAVYSGGE